MLINDHTTSSKRLLSAAKKDDLAVEPETTSKHAAQLDALSNDRGEVFDTPISRPRWQRISRSWH
ncbi:DUF4142 domain-containing protein [Mesorhizobium sp. B2-3-4]|nr:DUF4142 domain-containing protein [Mesorhizobium sp. B2-3-4]